MYEQARECLERAVELRPGNTDFRYALEQVNKTGALTRFFNKLKNIFK